MMPRMEQDTRPTQELRALLEDLQPELTANAYIQRQLDWLDNASVRATAKRRLLELRVSYLEGELRLLKQRPWWQVMMALEGVLRGAADASMQRRHEQIDRIREREGTLS